MKDVSIFQGWKEFHGPDGQIRLVDNGGIWGVYKHNGESYIFAGNIEKMSKETNLALYKRAIEMTEAE